MPFFENFDQQVTYWTWLILATVFLALEFAIPGVIFLWFGVAATVTALIVAIGPQMGWETQFVLFGVLSLISAYFGRRYVKWRPVKSQDDTLNRRGEQYVGRVFEVVQAIENGEGRVKVGDGAWNARGPDVAVGEKVKVIDVSGINLLVEPVKSEED